MNSAWMIRKFDSVTCKTLYKKSMNFVENSVIFAEK